MQNFFQRLAVFLVLAISTNLAFAQSKKAAPKEPAPNCFISEFRHIGMSIHDPIDRAKQAQQWLENLGCDSANKYLRLANNIPLFAQELWQKDALTAHNALFDGFIKLIKGQLDPLLFAEQCFSQQQLPMINWMLSWLADAIKVQLQTKAERIVDIDSLANLKVITERLHLESIYEIMDSLTKINQLEQSQVNQQLMLEEMAIQCYSLTVNKGKS